MESNFQGNQVSKPISIPKKVNRNIYNNEYVSLNDNNTIQSNYSNNPYSLKENFFDPNKSSPPNFWSNRLLDRFQHY